MEISRILFGWFVSVKPWNCKCEVKNPQDLDAVGLRKYGSTVGHVLHVISCICTLFFTGRSKIASTDILFAKELCLSHLK